MNEKKSLQKSWGTIIRALCLCGTIIGVISRLGPGLKPPPSPSPVPYARTITPADLGRESSARNVKSFQPSRYPFATLAGQHSPQNNPDPTPTPPATEDHMIAEVIRESDLQQQRTQNRETSEQLQTRKRPLEQVAEEDKVVFAPPRAQKVGASGSNAVFKAPSRVVLKKEASQVVAVASKDLQDLETKTMLASGSTEVTESPSNTHTPVKQPITPKEDGSTQVFMLDIFNLNPSESDTRPDEPMLVAIDFNKYGNQTPEEKTILRKYRAKNICVVTLTSELSSLADHAARIPNLPEKMRMAVSDLVYNISQNPYGELPQDHIDAIHAPENKPTRKLFYEGLEQIFTTYNIDDPLATSITPLETTSSLVERSTTVLREIVDEASEYNLRASAPKRYRNSNDINDINQTTQTAVQIASSSGNSQFIPSTRPIIHLQSLNAKIRAARQVMVLLRSCRLTG